MLDLTIGSDQPEQKKTESEYVTSPDLFLQEEERANTAKPKAPKMEASPEPSSTSSPETKQPEAPTHFDDLLQENAPAEDPAADPQQETAPVQVFSEHDFIVFYSSVFNVSAVATGYKSLAIEKDDEMAIEGLKAIYSIGSRHPQLRWLISPIGQDFKDGIVAFQFLGKKARGVAEEMKDKREAKKQDAAVADMPPADREAAKTENADYERRKSNATTVKL